MINKHHVKALAEVREEINRQHKKHGGLKDHSPDRWLAILGEEYGEACMAMNDLFIKYPDDLQERVLLAAKNGGDTLGGYREELIQVAAVAVSAVETLDRNRGVL